MKSHPSSRAARLWQYQKERSPILALLAMAAVTVGVVSRFGMFTWHRFLAAVLIVFFYLIQIRVSDEKKDFEHDNRYYPDRPVQRGLVKLTELESIGTIAIIIQFVLYASFLDWKIFLAGIASQAYAFLCRREFFVRDRIRKHFFIYTFSHYVQLIFLFFAVITILAPHKLGWGELLAFTLVNISVVELGRKTKPKAQDMAGDTYSSHLGYPGTFIAVVIALVVNLALLAFLTARLGGHPAWLLLAGAAALASGWFASRYGKEPDTERQKAMENGVLVNFVITMLALILAA